MAKPKIKPEPIEVAGYKYCEKCDIYYNQKLFNKAEAERTKIRKSKSDMKRLELSLIESCPICASDFSNSIERVSAPRSRRSYRCDMSRKRHRP